MYWGIHLNVFRNTFKCVLGHTLFSHATPAAIARISQCCQIPNFLSRYQLQLKCHAVPDWLFLCRGQPMSVQLPESVIRSVVKADTRAKTTSLPGHWSDRADRPVLRRQPDPRSKPCCGWQQLTTTGVVPRLTVAVAGLFRSGLRCHSSKNRGWTFRSSASPALFPRRGI